jgi:hypothetical protein
LRYQLHNAVIPWMRAAGIFSGFLCGVGHRQDTRRCATIQHPCFKEVCCVRIGLFAKACVRVRAHGRRLHAIGGGRFEPCCAVPFRSVGEGMVRPSGSRTECGYADGARIRRLKIKPSGVTQPARSFTDRWRFNGPVRACAAGMSLDTTGLLFVASPLRVALNRS